MDILKNKVHQEMTSSAVSPDPCVAATIEEQDADFNQVHIISLFDQIAKSTNIGSQRIFRKNNIHIDKNITTN